ncbi:hypothetical protein Purlil1_13346 [Purpureocillium lilacinum]|uniref:Uncharacterized protein n=1 Tax=Purpureocillium lilacinum TaxID=33203 RepID=A0ABR0BEB1_PURLI|nr:hypothetical protein Purlil1_13346 [Purpureocillium lilacinum]
MPGHYQSTTTEWICPLFTCGVLHALAGNESSIRETLEQEMPSVWAADSEPTMQDVESWRITLLFLLAGLQKQYRLPFAWFLIKPGPKGHCGQRFLPVWRIFNSRAFASFYHTESLRQSAKKDVVRADGRHTLMCSPELEQLYEDYFGTNKADVSVLDGVSSLAGDQVVVWSILMALYTVGVLGFAAESTVVGQRVQKTVDALWPCVKRVALGHSPFV